MGSRGPTQAKLSCYPSLLVKEIGINQRKKEFKKLKIYRGWTISGVSDDIGIGTVIAYQ